MATIVKDIVTWLKQWYYTEAEVDTLVGGLQTQINNKADSTTVSSLSTTVGTKADKTGGVAQITDSNSANYTNIGSLSANATQQAINSAINTKLGELVGIDFITVVTTLPSASADTMGKIYLVAITGSGDNNFKEYITVRTGTSGSYTYAWEKLGEISGSGLSVDWSDITGKPSSFTPSSHTHGSVTNDGKIGSDSGKIITTGTGGVLQASASITKSLISDFPSSMTPSSHTHGNITNDGKVGSTSGKPLITTTGGAVTTGTFGTSSGQFAEGNHTHSDKADKTSALGTTITLVNKGETNEGCIIFNTIS